MNKPKDATGYLVIGMHNGNGPGAFIVVGIHADEEPARKQAESCAHHEHGAIYGVYQKVAVAESIRRVEWRGPAHEAR